MGEGRLKCELYNREFDVAHEWRFTIRVRSEGALKLKTFVIC